LKEGLEAGLAIYHIFVQQHNKFRQKCQTFDVFTPWILNLVENHMLLKSGSDRKRARDILERSELFLSRLGQVPIPSTNAAKRPESSSQIWRGSYPSRLALKAGSSDPLPATIPSPTKQGQGGFGIDIDPLSASNVHEAVVTLGDYIERSIDIGVRDQLFLIDDSESMRDNKEAIAEAFPLLRHEFEYLSNRVELVFASEPMGLRRIELKGDLARRVNRHEFRADGTLTPGNIGIFVDCILIEPLPRKVAGLNTKLWTGKNTRVHIFTDGNWPHRPTAKYDTTWVRRQLQRLVWEMRRRGLDGDYLSLTFVWFGDSNNGKALLQELNRIGQGDSFPPGFGNS